MIKLITKTIFFLSALFFLFVVVTRGQSVVISQNKKDLDALPHTFRIVENGISGSAQVTPKSLQQVMNKVKTQEFLLVDLREEPHGFLNNDAISWYKEHNWYYDRVNLKEVLRHEQELIDKLANQFVVVTYPHKRVSLPVFYFKPTTFTEQKLAEHKKIAYIRLPIKDHRRPDDATVDKIVILAKKHILNNENSLWFHFHCAAGKGRTTTVLAMIACMKYSLRQTLDQIIAHQYDLGGMQLLADAKKEDWNQSYAIARADFIKKFYQYCQQVPDFHILWTEWLSQQRT